ncbi:hydroxyacid dehydrogenase [Pseudomonas sp. Leaf127]|uniref:2-hydroxyacid dehydrogenase n=1 Tax=Pseudomonas sp. Leaf127 TaxID=1736267 RepID=UPI0007028D98|nr:2-hydroxyacid dehydrogenase [Pseudomonas sp. Leaf127]KQQ53893.1 hydroxyacid dehydrogenase [Pseudomonas sp. Leaf127]
MKIAFFSAQPYDRRFFDQALQRDFADAGLEFTYLAPTLSADTVALAQGFEAICVFVNDQLDAGVLATLKGYGVSAILLRCAGFNNVDLDAAKRLDLFVARVPGYSPEAVAEHTLALVMTLNRHTHRAYNRVREGNFMLDGLLGFNLHGKTVGIIGTGQIGLATARIFKGFGCRVLGFDPFQTEAFKALGEYVTLEQLLPVADIVSLHCPLLDSTRHLIRHETLAQMKPGAMLVNTSRGALIDTLAVIEALKSRQLGALAIDVYEQESQLFFQDRSGDHIDDEVFLRLTTFSNVLITGHQGFFTREALEQIAQVTLENLRCFTKRVACENRLA